MAHEWQIIITPALFGLVGFSIAFFTRKALNISIILLFGYAIVLLFTRLGLVADWTLLNDLAEALQVAGKKAIAIIDQLLESANAASILLFVLGGACGLFIKKGA